MSGAQRVAVRVGITSNIDSTSKSIQKNIKDKNNSSRSYMQVIIINIYIYINNERFIIYIYTQYITHFPL